MKMKVSSIVIVLTLISPVLQAGAMDLAINDNPYTPIVTRNIFGLVPIPTNVPVVDPASLNPPPKITPNGIMTIFGVKEALYKVAGTPKPGKPAVDQSYTMSEGEGQDDIEVVKIDTQADVITFNNHGKIQELPLVATAASSGSAGPGPSLHSAGSAMGGGRFPRPLGGPGFAGRRVVNNENANANANASPASPAFSGNQPPVGQYNQSAEGLSPEAQAILIEAERSKGGPTAPILPPTPITPHDGSPDVPEPPAP